MRFHITFERLYNAWSDQINEFIEQQFSNCDKDILILHGRIFCVNLDFLFLLLDTHIAHKDISSFHVLIFGVNLDFLMLLLDNHIANKDISSLHVLIFCVNLDLLLLLLYTHIAKKDILFLHELISCARTKKSKKCNVCGLTCHSKEYLQLHLIHVQ